MVVGEGGRSSGVLLYIEYAIFEQVYICTCLDNDCRPILCDKEFHMFVFVIPNLRQIVKQI